MIDCTPKDEHRRGVRVRERKCDACRGRGWVVRLGADVWPEPCNKCGGRSAFRTVQLARLLGVHRRDIYRVDTLTAGSRVGVRVLDAIIKNFSSVLY